jgi:hypothetical protein
MSAAIRAWLDVNTITRPVEKYGFVDAVGDE